LVQRSTMQSSANMARTLVPRFTTLFTINNFDEQIYGDLWTTSMTIPLVSVRMQP
jgi:hypothetical protein